MFQPKKINPSGKLLGQYDWITSKVVCVGRNYSAHAKELNNPIPKQPLLFIKSSNSLVDLEPVDRKPSIRIPNHLGECQYELEIAILIGQPLTHATDTNVRSAIEAVGLGLDLTLRELQSQLKSKSHPWERAKGFDASCPVTGFIAIEHFDDLSDIDFALKKNGQRVQVGNSKDMLFNIVSLIKEISTCFSLYPGDIILTGTPEGVGPLNSGDKICLELASKPIAQASII